MFICVYIYTYMYIYIFVYIFFYKHDQRETTTIALTGIYSSPTSNAISR